MTPPTWFTAAAFSRISRRYSEGVEPARCCAWWEGDWLILEVWRWRLIQKDRNYLQKDISLVVKEIYELGGCLHHASWRTVAPPVVPVATGHSFTVWAPRLLWGPAVSARWSQMLVDLRHLRFTARLRSLNHKASWSTLWETHPRS